MNFTDPTGLNGCGASDDEEIQVCGGGGSGSRGGGGLKGGGGGARFRPRMPVEDGGGGGGAAEDEIICPAVPATRPIGTTGLAKATIFDPTGILMAGEIRGLANEASRQRFPSLSSAGTARDAYRHFYGAFALTKLIGPTRALNILNAVEVSGNNPAADRNMDTYNNYVAIQMAQDVRNQGKATADLADAALKKGCLKVNK